MSRYGKIMEFLCLVMEKSWNSYVSLWKNHGILMSRYGKIMEFLCLVMDKSWNSYVSLWKNHGILMSRYGKIMEFLCLVMEKSWNSYVSLWKNHGITVIGLEKSWNSSICSWNSCGILTFVHGEFKHHLHGKFIKLYHKRCRNLSSLKSLFKWKYNSCGLFSRQSH